MDNYLRIAVDFVITMTNQTLLIFPMDIDKRIVADNVIVQTKPSHLIYPTDNISIIAVVLLLT